MFGTTFHKKQYQQNQSKTENAIDKHCENQEMKYNHNANIELKTGRNRSYKIIQRDDDKVKADKVVHDQCP